MEDIELVIKIPEKVYNALTHTEFDAHLVVDEMRKAIANGTPLPKGHGRLIDADELNKCIVDRITMPFVPINKIQDALTIIEADKAESEE